VSLPTGPERTGPLTGPGLAAAARTNRGPRDGNEDAFVCRPDLGLFAAIDGMGGQVGGERAAALAREALLSSADPLQAIRTANEKIHEMAEKDAALRGMGCVASAVRIEEAGARIIHVGDTRVYLAGRAGCEQLTRDHTVAARRQEDMGISAPAARGIAGHNQVTRDIGGKPQKDDTWVDRLEVDLEAGDLLMLCSDGLHGAIPAADLFARLRRARKEDVPPVDLVDSLLELALKNGTKDNVTVVVARYTPGTKPWWARDVKELFNRG
jgi:serine/threonine protein phosphatase PrpC